MGPEDRAENIDTARVGIVPDNDDNQLDQRSQLTMLISSTQLLKFERKFKEGKESKRNFKKYTAAAVDGLLLSF